MVVFGVLILINKEKVSQRVNLMEKYAYGMSISLKNLSKILMQVSKKYLLHPKMINGLVFVELITQLIFMM